MNNVMIEDWLESLAAKVPTPGGGAVAALAAAIAAAQLSMVAIYTTGPKWQDREARMLELNEELTGLRTQALALVEADAAAFASVGAAYQLPKDTDEQKAGRTAAIQKALTEAADPPVKTAQLASRLVEIAADIAEQANPNVISDVAVAASMARASLESAIVNIEINEHSLTDVQTKQTLQETVKNATKTIQQADAITELVRDQMEQA